MFLFCPGLDISPVEIDFRAEGFKSAQVNVDRTFADRASSRKGYVRFAESSEKRSQNVHRRAHGFHDFIRNKRVGDAVNLNDEGIRRRIERRLRAEEFYHADDCSDVSEIRHIPERGLSVREKARHDDGKRRVLRAGDFHSAVELLSAVYMIIIHRFLRYFLIFFLLRREELLSIRKDRKVNFV